MQSFIFIPDSWNNGRDFIDYLSAFGPTVAAFVAAGVAVWQLCISAQQKNISIQQKRIYEQQKELQRCSFVYDAFIKEKQQKIIELRELYLEFQERCVDFISIIFPNAIMAKDQRPGECPNIDFLADTDEAINAGYFLNSISIEEEKYFETNRDIAGKLNLFLNKNAVFLKDDPILYEDLQIVSKAFLELFSDMQNKPKIWEIILPIISMLNKVGLQKEIFYPQDNRKKVQIVRRYFYEFMQYRLVLTRNNCREGMLYMSPNSYFSIKRPFYTSENITKWSENDLIAFSTHTAFIMWFETWKKSIDNFFKVSFEDINKVIKNKT